MKRKIQKESEIKPKKDKWCTMHFLTTHWLMLSQSLSGDSSLLAHSPWFVYRAWHYMGWNIALASLDQLSWLHPLPTSCAPPAFLPAGHEKLKNPWFSINTSNKNISVLSTLFSYWIQNTALYQLLGRKSTLSQLKPGEHSWWPLLAFIAKSVQKIAIS